MAPATSLQWYVTRRGAVEGPYSEAALREMYAAGALLAHDKIWTEGEPEWCLAADVFGRAPVATPIGLLARLARRLIPGAARR